MGTLEGSPLLARESSLFSYARYDVQFEELPTTGSGSRRTFPIDDPSSLSRLREIGESYAEQHVLPEHLFPRP